MFDLEADGSPSAAEVDALAAGGCTKRYEAYAGEPVDPTTERAFAELVPSSASWEEGDRRVVCLARSSDRDAHVRKGAAAISSA